MWGLLVVACSPGGGQVSGTVLDAGDPVGGAEVRVGEASTWTDDAGGFVVQAAAETPVAVVHGDDLVASFDCAPEVTLDVAEPPPLATGTLAIVLREVRPGGVLHLHAAVDLGTPRAPAPTPVELGPVSWADDGARTRTAQVALPAAGRWSIAVSSLVAEAWRGRRHEVVDQVMVVGGEGLAPGEVRYVEAPMSAETLRQTVYWDRSGPTGVELATFLQRVDVRGVPVDVTTWRGPVAEPTPVAAIQIIPGDPIEGVRGVFSYNGAGPCTRREVGMDAVLEAADVPGWLADPGGGVDRVPGVVMRLPEPFPSPPMLDLGDGLAWSMVPRQAVDLTLALVGPAGRVRGAGRGTCEARWLPVDEDLADATGELTWADADAWGRCVVGDDDA